jgi:hypothetical protein
MRRGLLVIGLLAMLVSWSAPARAASITFNSQNVDLAGGPFRVDISVTGLTDPVIGYLLNFTFDSTVLTLNQIVEGDFMSRVGPTSFDPTPLVAGVQTVTSFLTNPADVDTGAGILVGLIFVPAAVGNGNLAILSEVISGELQFFTEFATGGEPIRPDVIAGAITVSTPEPIPEPSTLSLMGIGLAALARGLRRRTRARTEAQAHAS